MEANLNAAATAPENETARAPEIDDRYVHIAKVVAEYGKSVREEVFKAAEAGRFEELPDLAEKIRKLDFCFMLAMQTGMKLREGETKERAAEAERLRLATAACAEAAAAAARPEPRRRFFGKTFGG